LAAGHPLSTSRESRPEINTPASRHARRPACCHVVPVLYEGLFHSIAITAILEELIRGGSEAVPGFMKPEGIVIYHQAAKQLFKKTIEKDDKPKGQIE